MSVSSVNMLHGILWNSTLISQIQSSRTNPGITHLVTHGAGAPQPMFAGNLKQQPMVSFDSTQIKSLLDITGSTIVGQTNVDLFYRIADSNGERTAAASAAHNRLRMAAACIMPERLSARDGGEASMSASIYARYNGSDEPVVPAGSTALTGTPSSAEHFTCGTFKVNGSAIAGVQSIDVDFGINLHRLGGDGELYDSFFTVADFRPVITARVLTYPWSTIGLNGVSDDVTFYLRKINATSRAADNGTVAISFTISSAYITIDDTSGGGNETATTTISVRPVSSDGTTAPMVIDTTADIT